MMLLAMSLSSLKSTEQAAIKDMSSTEIVKKLYEFPAGKLLPKTPTAIRKIKASASHDINEEFAPTKVNPLARILPAASIMPGPTNTNAALATQSGIAVCTSNLVTVGNSKASLSNRFNNRGNEVSRGFPGLSSPF